MSAPIFGSCPNRINHYGHYCKIGGICPLAVNRPCILCRGEWGTWRSVLAEMTENIDDPDNCYTVQWYLETVGWRPWRGRSGP